MAANLHKIYIKVWLSYNMKYHQRPKAQKISSDEMERIKIKVDEIFKRDYGVDFKTKTDEQA